MAEHGTSMTERAGALGSARSAMDERAKKTMFASGGMLGALAMSSCCILPLVLFSLGVTGAWIGNLAALYPYKLYFLVPTAALLAAGFYTVYRNSPLTKSALDASGLV